MINFTVIEYGPARGWSVGIGIMRSAVLRLGAVVLATLVFVGPLLPAAPCRGSGNQFDRQPLFSAYVHAGWSRQNGFAFGPIAALAQTTNGYLWLGTDNGLVRFDGLRAAPWKAAALPASKITHLLANRGGDLWVGTAGGVALLDPAGNRKPLAPAGVTLPADIVETMALDGQNNLWLSVAAAQGSQLFKIANGNVTNYVTPKPLLNGRIFAILPDLEGSLWLGGPGGFCSWKSGAAACTLLQPGSTIGALAMDAGEPIVADDSQRGLFRVRGGKFWPAVSDWNGEPPVITSVLVDRGHAIWVGTLSQGVFRIEGCRVDRFTTKDGLTSDQVKVLLEDREGNIWAGTARGLDRFSRRRVRWWSTQDGLASNLTTSVLATAVGDIWIGTANGLNRLSPRRRMATYATGSGLPGQTVLSLAEDAGRTVWVATNLGLARFDGERFIAVRGPDAKALERVFLMAPAPDGTLWLFDAQEGLLQAHGGDIRAAPFRQKLGGKGIYQMLVDGAGRLWLGNYEGGVSVAAGGVLVTYGPKEGLSAGRVNRLLQTRDAAVWACTGAGLSRFRNGRWTTWTPAEGIPDGGINDIVEDRSGGLWLVTRGGILRASIDDLARTPDGAPQPIRFQGPYGPSDGIAFANGGKMTNPRSAVSADGVVWIQSEDGVATVDPARLPSNLVPPPVDIGQLLVDGKPVDPRSGTLSFHARDVLIGYTALSLTAPEAIRFRYRLKGAENAWKDAQGVRQISYLNLAPGRYRFEVTACNNDGYWNENGAALAFSIAPYFYQTSAFWTLCLLASFGAIYLLYRIRLNSVRSRLQLIVEERARLTREVHDTLLQGFAGVVYKLEAVVRQQNVDPQAAQQRLLNAVDQADKTLQEARAALSNIDTQALRHGTLPEAIRNSAKQILDGTSIAFNLILAGNVRELPPQIQVNLYIIAREAIGNAVTHANAQHIRTRLAYEPGRVVVEVEDDGCGFNPAIAILKENHWGLKSMRERAKNIGAEYRLETTPGTGTRISVVTPIRGRAKSAITGPA